MFCRSPLAQFAGGYREIPRQHRPLLNDLSARHCPRVHRVYTALYRAEHQSITQSLGNLRHRPHRRRGDALGLEPGRGRAGQNVSRLGGTWIWLRLNPEQEEVVKGNKPYTAKRHVKRLHHWAVSTNVEKKYEGQKGVK